MICLECLSEVSSGHWNRFFSMFLPSTMHSKCTIYIYFLSSNIFYWVTLFYWDYFFLDCSINPNNWVDSEQPKGCWAESHLWLSTSFCPCARHFNCIVYSSWSEWPVAPVYGSVSGNCVMLCKTLWCSLLTQKALCQYRPITWKIFSR